MRIITTDHIISAWPTMAKGQGGTALQGGRPRVRFPIAALELFIDLILPAALWPSGRLSLQQKLVLGIFSGGVKVAGA
jgi:hypothetical protein